MRTVGILGGGQLGWMLADALLAHGARVRVLDPDPAAPALARLPDATVAAFEDEVAVARFASACDVVTCEFENVPLEAARLAARFAPLRPDARVLAITQHRLREKELLRKEGLPHGCFAPAGGTSDLAEAAAQVGFPLVAKTVRGGYDGKGQLRVTSPAELAHAVTTLRADGLESAGFVLEEEIDLACELSCIVARSGSGQEIVFPVVENLHRDHVLDFTLLPARVSQAVAAAAQRIALAAARSLGVVDLLAVELFVARRAPRSGASEPVGGVHLLVNELAPRPHNSGHVTRVMGATSQFDALARVLLDLPLVAPRAPEGGALCMGNLLGDLWRRGAPPAAVRGAAPGAQLEELVLYGKREARPRRKMGHFTLRDVSPDAALARARALREAWRTE